MLGNSVGVAWARVPGSALRRRKANPIRLRLWEYGEGERTREVETKPTNRTNKKKRGGQQRSRLACRGRRWKDRSEREQERG